MRRLDTNYTTKDNVMTMNEVHQDRALSTEADWFSGALAPLREGKVVKLRLLLPKKNPGKRKLAAEPPDPLITILPGELIGFPKRTVVVSVINNGSCIVEIDCNSVTRLVIAGIPAVLAKALLRKLQSTLGETNHGNSTNPQARSKRKKRPSSGAAGWKRPPPSVTIVTRSAYRYTSRSRSDG